MPIFKLCFRLVPCLCSQFWPQYRTRGHSFVLGVALQRLRLQATSDQHPTTVGAIHRRIQRPRAAQRRGGRLAPCDGSEHPLRHGQRHARVGKPHGGEDGEAALKQVDKRDFVVRVQRVVHRLEVEGGQPVGHAPTQCNKAVAVGARVKPPHRNPLEQHVAEGRLAAGAR